MIMTHQFSHEGKNSSADYKENWLLQPVRLKSNMARSAREGF